MCELIISDLIGGVESKAEHCVTLFECAVDGKFPRASEYLMKD